VLPRQKCGRWRRDTTICCGVVLIEIIIGMVQARAMRTKAVSLRGLFCAFIAVAFMLAAEPGAMAMPAPHSMTMHSAHHAASGCDHMKTQKEPGAPCKSTSVCLGMLSCFGMVTAAVHHIALTNVALYSRVGHHDEPTLGLTYPPDNPPPIS